MVCLQNKIQDIWWDLLGMEKNEIGNMGQDQIMRNFDTIFVKLTRIYRQRAAIEGFKLLTIKS